MKIEEIEFNKIQVLENSRTTVKTDEIHSLMESINQHGLEQPIGLAKTENDKYVILYGHRRLLACKKLGWKKIPAVIYDKKKIEDILTLNIVENIHRENLSPFELGRIISKLKDLKLNDKEIAVRLSIPLSRIQSALEIFRHIPAAYSKKIRYMQRGDNNKNGKAPAFVVKRILDLRRSFKLRSSQTKMLLDATINHDISANQMNIVASLINKGANIKTAVRGSLNYHTIRVDVIITNQQREELKKKNKSIQQGLLNIIYGDIKPIERPIIGDIHVRK